MASNYFVSQCRKVIPREVRIRIVCWSERAGGEKLHNRYILTDIGGVQFGIGLDDSDGFPGQTDDLYLLDREQFAMRWAQYTQPNPAFKLEWE